MDQKKEKELCLDTSNSVFIKLEVESHSEELEHIVKLEELPIDSMMKVEYTHLEGYSGPAANFTNNEPEISENLTEVWIKKELNNYEESNCSSPCFIVADDISDVHSSLYSCTLCDMKFTEISSLAKHFQVHSRNMHVCIVCNDHLIEVERHSENDSFETSEASFICHDCSNKYSCETCGEGFAKLIDLKYHETENHACQSIDKMLSESNALKVDTRRQTSVKSNMMPNSCDLCDKSFKYLSHLKSHMRTHTDERPYSCEFCNKSFRAMHTLNVHIRTHTGEKPYACDFCDKSFMFLSTLNSHISKHTGEKPYPCRLCDKSFTQSIGLKRHMRTHTGEKPFACDFCDTKFTYPFQLKAHLKKHAI